MSLVKTEKDIDHCKQDGDVHMVKGSFLSIGDE